jgi:hypothetical protein
MREDVRRDGGLTRELNELCNSQRANRILVAQISNDSVVRISAELATTDSQSLVFYGDETKPPFKIWCLDDPKGNQPIAELGGLAVSLTPCGDNIDDIFNKQYSADDFDQSLATMPRENAVGNLPFKLRIDVRPSG